LAVAGDLFLCFGRLFLEEGLVIVVGYKV
jgi:hypothetical protein